MVSAAHLKVIRQHGLFYHHGIYLGDGTIAHYLEGREILRSKLQDFAQGQQIKVVNHPTASSRTITLRRAMKRLGEQKYNLLFNNCEHFANWCKTGLHRSSQTEGFLKATSLTAIAFEEILPSSCLKVLKLIFQQEILDTKSKKKSKDI